MWSIASALSAAVWLVDEVGDQHRVTVGALLQFEVRVTQRPRGWHDVHAATHQTARELRRGYRGKPGRQPDGGGDDVHH
jgi:hypothetical protein